MEDVVLAKFDYAMLDQKDAQVRFLNSTAVHAAGIRRRRPFPSIE